MPELPEVEFARGCLERWLGGEKLARVEADRGRVTRGTPLSAFEALAGHTVKRVERRGKWLLWHFDDGTGVLAHLGMTGKFEMTEADAVPRSSRVRFVRRDGAVVHYRDPRQFGRLQVAQVRELLERDPLASLGPDAHEPPLGQVLLKERLGTRKRSIKDVLMDQTVVAGLGNIQVTDALYLAKIHPLRSTASLTSAEITALSKAIRKSLLRTLAMNRGDKIVYVEESQRRENPFYIYGKAGQPCPRCKTTLRKISIASRTTAFCPHCQEKPRGQAARKRK